MNPNNNLRPLELMALGTVLFVMHPQFCPTNLGAQIINEQVSKLYVSHGTQGFSGSIQYRTFDSRDQRPNIAPSYRPLNP